MKDKTRYIIKDTLTWILISIIAASGGAMFAYKHAENSANIFLFTEFYNVSYARCLDRCNAYDDISIYYNGARIEAFKRDILINPGFYINYTNGDI